VELKGQVCDHPIMLFTNAFRTQMALTRAIEAFIGSMSGSGSILMLARDDLGSPCLDVYFGGESCEKIVKEAVAKFDEWQEFEELASSLGMRYNWQASDADFVLFFPGGQTPERTVPSK
jgi:hypothetical protein